MALALPMRSPGYKRALVEADKSKYYQLHYGLSVIPKSKIITDWDDALASTARARCWKKYRKHQYKQEEVN